jgi:hypothetical protein
MHAPLQPILKTKAQQQLLPVKSKTQPGDQGQSPGGGSSVLELATNMSSVAPMGRELSSMHWNAQSVLVWPRVLGLHRSSRLWYWSCLTR